MDLSTGNLHLFAGQTNGLANLLESRKGFKLFLVQCAVSGVQPDHSIQEIMGQKEVTHTNWLEQYTVRRDDPANLDPQHDSLFSFEKERSFGPVDIYYVSNTTLTDDGLLFKDGRIFPHCLRHPSWNQIYGRVYYLKQRFRKKRFTLDPDRQYALCYDLWCKAYYHWMCDALPRFLQMKMAHPDIVFLLPEPWNKGFFKETLDRIGITNIQTIPWGTLALVPNLSVIDFIARPGNYHPGTMLELRDKLLSGIVAEKHIPGIYASRAKAPFKFVVNEEEIVAAFREYGVETCYFEEQTFKDQLQMMQGTTMLTGMHGANLTNMLFLPPGSNIFEFREYGDAKNNCYYTLASLLGHHYYYQLCNRGDRPYDHYNRFDIVVDAAILRKNLEHILKQDHSGPGK